MKKSERIQLELKQIKKRNKQFLNASPSEKRIMIAEDGLEQIKLKKYIAKSGTYFVSSKVLNVGISLQEELLTKQPVCTVCQIGGLFASCARVGNEINVTIPKDSNLVSSIEAMYDTPMRTYLAKFFSSEQIILIESAFEEINMEDEIIDSQRYVVEEDSQDLFLKNLKEMNINMMEAAVSYRTRKKTNSRNDFDFSYNERRRDELAMIAIFKNIISNGGRFRPDR